MLDACVLYPILIADALLSLAVEKLYAAKWTMRIEDEFIAAAERDRPDLKGKLGRRRDSMRKAVPDWEVPESAWSSLVDALELPDPSDRHVLAAALVAHADCVVTFNTRDFPAERIENYVIEAIDPDTFLINQMDLDQVAALTAFKKMRARWKNPELTPEAFASAFERAGLPGMALRLREAAALI